MASRNGDRSATPKATRQRNTVLGAAAATAPKDRPAGSAAAAEPSPADRALAWLHSARFLTSASLYAQLPPALQPEIAFVGRSNAGKSTAINTLTRQRQLAFASRTPGRTQLINLFEVGPADAPDARLADLPGYGYAAVARDNKARWQHEMTRYLAERPSLRAIVLLADARLGLTDLDRRLLELVAPRLAEGTLRALVLLTKADKLSRAQVQTAVRDAQAPLGDLLTDASDVRVSAFSALSGLGLGDAAEVLREWVDA
jgi:GTP-binding protein